MNPTLVLLAAGIGSRYGGLKQVDAVGPSGETIMDYSIFDAARAGFDKVIFVIRKETEMDFRKVFTHKLEGKVNFGFAYQELDSLPAGTTVPAGRVKPWGTGHAVMVAADQVHEPFAVINADDFYGLDACRKMAGFLSTSPGPEVYSMVGYDLENTLSDFGFVSRGICKATATNTLVSITERTKIRKTHGQIAYQDESETLVFLPGKSMVSMNFWGFNPLFFSQLQDLFRNFLESNQQQLSAEFYLSTAIDTLIRQGKAQVTVLHTEAHWFGVTYREDKPRVMERVSSLIKAGLYPENLWG